MNWEEAIGFLVEQDVADPLPSDRYNIRRAVWPKDCYVRFVLKELPFRIATGFGTKDYAPSLVDLDANDWELTK